MPRLIFFSVFLWSHCLYAQTNSNNKITEIASLIKQNYMTNINVDSILNTMHNLDDTVIIRKLLSHLDPFSHYLNEKDYSDMKTMLKGNFYGIGLVFNKVDDTILISQVFSNGPADKAGLKTGDKIITVNDSAITGVHASYDMVVEKIRGLKSTTVKLGVQRNNNPKHIDIYATRDKINVHSVVAAYMPDKETGYIKIIDFTDSTLNEVQAALRKLNATGMKKILLDLRDNTGGLVKQATGVADEFLSSNKLIVYTEGKPGTREDVYATAGGLFENGKIVVLVNENTVSAAEILTGALQDNKRAIIVGNRTFGKGLVQKIYPLSDSATALKLTIAKYYTPSGKCIEQPYTGSEFMYTRKNENLYSNNNVLPDSVKKNTLLDWGIIPNIFIARDTTAEQNFFMQLDYRLCIAQAAYAYYSNNTAYFSSFKNINDFAEHYHPDDAVLSNVKKQLDEGNNATDNYFPPLKYTDADLTAVKSKIENAFKAYIAQERWGDEGYYQLINSTDEDVQEAISVLKK